MRCPDCNGFRSYDTEAEPDGNLEIDAEGMITGEVTRDLPCVDCGTVLKSAEFTVDQDLNEIVDVVLPPGKDIKVCTTAHDWDWTDPGDIMVEPTERLNDIDKNGNKIKFARFMTRYYGIEVSGDVRCKDCPATGVYSLKDEMPAGSFEEQV